MVETLYSKMAPWVSGTGPESAIAVLCQASLMRNLADFPFPEKCPAMERRMVEDRLIQALESTPLAAGQYCPLADLDVKEAFFLAERRLFPFDLFSGRSHSGVYVADDQSLSVAVNGLNHMCTTVTQSGIQLDELWSRLDLLDNMLGNGLDFAFDKHIGYLTSLFAHLGTGLKMSVILHLPALAMNGGIGPSVQEMRSKSHKLYGMKPVTISQSAVSEIAATGEPAHDTYFGEALYYDVTESMYVDAADTVGDLYLLTNQATLGVSEEEIVFHLRRAAQDLVDKEKRAREEFLHHERRRMEDRVARALGVARSARLLGFAEGASLLSSVRFGIGTDLLTGFTYPRINELLFASQSAHLKMKAGRECDEEALSMERADLFRTRFCQDRKGF